MMKEETVLMRTFEGLTSTRIEVHLAMRKNQVTEELILAYDSRARVYNGRGAKEAGTRS